VLQAEIVCRLCTSPAVVGIRMGTDCRQAAYVAPWGPAGHALRAIDSWRNLSTFTNTVYVTYAEFVKATLCVRRDGGS
jgi:hypothetical protein